MEKYYFSAFSVFKLSVILETGCKFIMFIVFVDNDDP